MPWPKEEGMMGWVTNSGLPYWTVCVGHRRLALLGAGKQDPHLKWCRDMRRSQGNRKEKQLQGWE